MKIASFKVSGKQAHFRKYFANNTAFSFSIPPRTTVMGMLAAYMGWSKDSYYERLASENIHFGVRVLTPTKKTFHRLNFLSIKSLGDVRKSLKTDFRGVGGRIQTPFEIVTGFDMAKDEVAYQVFIGQKDEALFEEITKRLVEGNPRYSITLGLANFSARVSEVKVIADSNIKLTRTEGPISFHSAIPVHLVDELVFDDDKLQYQQVEEDILPGEFVANDNREVKTMNKLLFSSGSHPLKIKVKRDFYQLQLGKETLNIQFMDA